MGGNSAIKALERRHRKAEKGKKPDTPKKESLPRHLNPTAMGLRNPNQHIPVIRIDTLDAPCGSKLQAEVISDEMVYLTIEKATAYINLPIFPGERDVSDERVQVLFDCMQRGLFNWTNTHLATILLDGITYKGNGQHTSWAVAFMNEAHRGFRSAMPVRETGYRVRTNEQMRLLYSTFDRNYVRGDGHIGKVLLVDKEVTKGVNNNSIGSLVRGIKLWQWPSRNLQKRLGPDHAAAFAEKEIPALFRAVAYFLQDKCKDYPMVWRQAVVAAMFATFEKSAQKAPEFWEPVANGLGLTRKDDPRHKLHEWLTDVSITGGRGGRGAVAAIGAEGMYMVCISQWNRWRKGETTQVIRTPLERSKPV